MPYYKWKGIDLTGTTCHGVRFATSIDELEKILFKDEVAVFDTAVTKTYTIKTLSLTRSETCELLKQISVLVTTGVFLTDALNVIMSQTRSSKTRHFIERIAAEVHAGNALSHAFEQFPETFNVLIITAVRAGETSGNLGLSLERVCKHMERMENFYKKMRAAALVPLVTVLFFIGIAGAILSFIVPYFATIIRTNGKHIPWSTSMLMQASEWCTRYNLIMTIGLIGSMGLLVKLLYKGNIITPSLDFIWLRIPYVKLFVRNISLVYFFEALSLLVHADVVLVQALTIAVDSVRHSIIKRHLEHIIFLVDTGHSLSDALQQGPLWLFGNDLIIMVKVSQESGTLRTMIDRIVNMYEVRVQDALTVCTTLFQPLLMIILGLLVAFLIFAVYIPIFTLSDTIGLGGF